MGHSSKIQRRFRNSGKIARARDGIIAETGGEPVMNAPMNATMKTPYASKLPGPDGRFDYSPEEDAVWGELFDRQMAFLPGKVAPEYLDGVAALGLTRDHVPQIAEIDATLARLTGAGVEGVPAIIPPSKFFELLSRRKFPVATFLRRREDIDYIEEPDLFHEVFGHCPLLTDPAYVDFIERFGKMAVALGKGYSWRLFRLFWFTVEFGMMRTPEGLRAYGAGIVGFQLRQIYLPSMCQFYRTRPR
jgi:phenylalanine-4-hydroxylase